MLNWGSQELMSAEDWTYNGTYEDFTQLTSVTTLFIVLYSVVIAAGFLGNLFLVLTIWLAKSSRSLFCCYMVNLIVIDVLFCVLVIPLTLVEYTSDIDSSIYTPFLCSFVSYVRLVLVFVNLWTLAAWTVDRWWILKFDKPIRKCWTYVTIATIWIITCLLMLIKELQPYTLVRVHLESHYGTIERELCQQTTSTTFRQVWTTILFVCLIVTLVFTLVINILSFKSGGSGLTTLSEDYSKYRQAGKMTKMAAVVMALFALAWLPLSFYIIIVTYEEGIVHSGNAIFSLLTLYFIGFCNSFINPCIYAIVCVEFRVAYKEAIAAVVCRRDHSGNKKYFPEIRRSFNKETRNSHLKDDNKNQTELQVVGMKETRSTMAGTTSYPPDLCIHANGNINYGLNLDEVTVSDNFDSYVARPFAENPSFYTHWGDYNLADERRYHSQYLTPSRSYEMSLDHDRKRFSLPALREYRESRRVSMEDKEVAAIMSQEIQRMKRNERSRQVGLPAEYQSNILATIRPLGETPRDNPNFRRVRPPETHKRDRYKSHVKCSQKRDVILHDREQSRNATATFNRTSDYRSPERYHTQQVLPSKHRPEKRSYTRSKNIPRYDSSDSPSEVHVRGRRYQRERGNEVYDGRRVLGRAEMRTSDYHVKRAHKRTLKSANSYDNRGFNNRRWPRYHNNTNGMESTTDDDDNRSTSESSNCSCSSPCSQCSDESPIFSEDEYSTPKRYCLSDSDFEFHTTEYETEQTASENEAETAPASRYQYHRNPPQYRLETVQEEPHYLFMMRPLSSKTFVQLTEPVDV